jgi:hypothetical protein
LTNFGRVNILKFFSTYGLRVQFIFCLFKDFRNFKIVQKKVFQNYYIRFFPFYFLNLYSNSHVWRKNSTRKRVKMTQASEIHTHACRLLFFFAKTCSFFVISTRMSVFFTRKVWFRHAQVSFPHAKVWLKHARV